MRTNKHSGPGSSVNFIKRAVSITTLALVCSTLPICVAQQRGRLAKIEVVGLKRLTPEQVIATSELQIGQTVDPEALDAAAEKLNSSGLFKKLSYRVHFTGNQVTLTFQVEEAARNLPVVFENFVWFSDDEMFRAIRQDLPFFDGTSPEVGNSSTKIAAALQRLLDGKRIPGRVEFLPYSNERGKTELVFTAKGVRLPICGLHFPGAEAIVEKDLIESSRELLKSDYSKKDAAAFAHYTLFPLYRKIGRLRATFSEPTAALDTSQCADGVSVTIPVNEGLAYTWDNAEWSGIQALTAEELSVALGMKFGEIANGFKIDEGLKEVRKAFAHRGYIVANAQPAIDFDDASSRVTYRFAVNEGPRYFMGTLIVSGLSADLEEQLRSMWTLGANAVYDATYVDDFAKNTLLRFIGTQMQRSSAFRLTAETDVKPDRQKHTVDVVITFKSRDKQ
jgi:outer membrane protein assembly factor BamA